LQSAGNSRPRNSTARGSPFTRLATLTSAPRHVTITSSARPVSHATRLASRRRCQRVTCFHAWASFIWSPCSRMGGRKASPRRHGEHGGVHGGRAEKESGVSPCTPPCSPCLRGERILLHSRLTPTVGRAVPDLHPSRRPRARRMPPGRR